MEKHEDGLSSKNTWNIAWALFMGHSLITAVFVRGRWGARTLGLSGLMAGIVWYGWVLCTQSQTIWEFGMFAFGFYVLRRIDVLIRWYRGDVEHSEYRGRPFWMDGWLWRQWGGRDWVARLLEGGLVIAIGWFIYPYEWALGKLLIASGLSTWVMEAIQQTLTANYQQAIDDAHGEADWMADYQRR